MNYTTFKNKILSHLADDIPDPKHISLQQIRRNNGDMLDGLLILENGTNIAPTLYLNHYYSYFQSGHSFWETYDRLKAHYESNKTSERIDAAFFTDFSKASPHIALKLIHYDKNRELLRDIPHLPFLDLAIVFFSYFPMEAEFGSATILIHHSHMELWQQTVDSLYPLAMENTRRMFPPKLSTINEVLTSMMPDTPYPTVLFPDDPLFPMYILCNEKNMFGASAMLFEDTLPAYAEQFRSDFYILPSSIHEVILVPTLSDQKLADFSVMVQQVNETQVAPEEVLSDHAYFYSREKRRIIF